MRILLIAIVGLVSPACAQDNPAMEQRLAKWLQQFPEADTNKDGKLTMEEANAFKAKMQEQRQADKKKSRVEPTHADVKYGDHERQVFDVWLPEKEKAGEGRVPVLIFFHGGGFVAGDKRGFDPSSFLEAGIACVSSNYRFVDGRETLCPIPMQDGARVVQTVRHRADEWNIDSGRVAISGSSAGAVMTLWIGYHDDLKQPDSEDPVARQSTRATCLIPLNGPTNLNPDWIRKHIGGAKHVHGSYVKMYGEPADKPMTEKAAALLKESNPWNLISKDDPPTMTVYGGKLDNLPLPEDASTGLSIHHPYFGKALKEKLDELEIENVFQHGSDPRRDGTSLIDFLRNYFAMVD